MKVEFFKHNIDEEDIENAARVLRSIFLTTGKEVADFESAFADYLGLRAAVGLTSCTGALHLALLAKGVKAGDEVITTALSYVATATAIECTGAKAVFVDVEPQTGNIDVKNIEEAFTEHTKAIVPVHLYGLMCDMKRLKTIAQSHSLMLIEDAAHAIEATRDAIRPGQLSDAACFSFYATKNITSGEGGAVATNDLAFAERLKKLRSHGISEDAADRYTKKYKHYDLEELGWKYNMDNIQAALLIGQLQKIETLLTRREQIGEQYDQAFQNVEGITLLKNPPEARSARCLYTIQVDPAKRDDILHYLQDCGVGVAVNYRPIHLMHYFRKKYGFKAGTFPHAEKIGASTLSLPLYPKLKDEELKYVIKQVKTALSVC